MPELLNIGVSCRACGAVRGPRMESDNSGLEWRVCQNCWRSFSRWLGGDPDPDSPTLQDDFNGWLARKLFLDLRRLDQIGVVGRCEAVADRLYGDRGQQCVRIAKARRDGRLVCLQHLAANAPSFVPDEGTADRAYEMLGVIISRLVKRDKKLLDTIGAAIGLDSQPFARIKYGHGRGSTPIDLSERRFGKLVAVRMVERVGKGRHRYWLCRCDCGGEKEIRGDGLVNGYHLSCGCHRKEVMQQRSIQQQRDESGHYLPSTLLPGVLLG